MVLLAFRYTMLMWLLIFGFLAGNLLAATAPARSLSAPTVGGITGE